MSDPRARPTLFVPLIGIPAWLIFFAGGAVFANAGARAAAAPDLGQVAFSQLRDRGQVADGSYVSVNVEDACAAKRDEAQSVYVHFSKYQFDVCESRRKAFYVPARICDWPRPSFFDCSIPAKARDEILARPLGARPSRVLLVGEQSYDAKDRRDKGITSMVIASLVYGGLALFSRRRRKGGARIADERTWTLPIAAEEIPARIRKLEGEDRFEVIEEGSGRLVFIQGYSENAARGWGIRKANVFPRRATITWRSSPREPTQVVVRVEEDLVWWPKPLLNTMDALARESIASTLARVERVLNQP